ncbi:hypothetical protein EX30DRAFT_101706 [Ascodesmis nigricans]|uniref:Uncharacterized protein n=1 Tax=Ascodesmis nigricans TaxID=341454 RepID=A0A4S2N5A2_9PEZI|nr:hypothetical protein EX30DRAFT_101706 [Ascodesmis nigricans]
MAYLKFEDSSLNLDPHLLCHGGELAFLIIPATASYRRQPTAERPLLLSNCFLPQISPVLRLNHSSLVMLIFPVYSSTNSTNRLATISCPFTLPKSITSSLVTHNLFMAPGTLHAALMASFIHDLSTSASITLNLAFQPATTTNFMESSPSGAAIKNSSAKGTRQSTSWASFRAMATTRTG